MTASIKALSDGLSGELQVGGNPSFRFGADTSGQLAGFRNVLINGDMRINQRGVTIAAAANGAYGPDRWKKVDASNMTQIVEEFNYKPNKTYTLSGTNVTTQQLTSPASGHWTLPNIPITATNVQLEEGSIATPFEQRPIGLELSLCQRYYEKSFNIASAPQNGPDPLTTALPTETYLSCAIYEATELGNVGAPVVFKVPKRIVPTMTAYGNNTGGWYYKADGVGTFGACNFRRVTESLFCPAVDVSVNSPGYLSGHWTASAEL